MARAIIQDDRIFTNINGYTPHHMHVNQSTDIQRTIEYIRNGIDGDFNASANFLNELDIICHGLDYGLQLGSQFINHTNVNLFRPLAGRFGVINIHSCFAAKIYPNGCNGMLMCSRLAIITGARVRASIAEQYFTNTNAATASSMAQPLLDWNGDVGTWNTHGILVNSQCYTDPRYRTF